MLECCSRLECAFCANVSEPTDFYKHLTSHHPSKLNESRQVNQSAGIFNFSQQKSLTRLGTSSKQLILSKTPVTKSIQFLPEPSLVDPDATISSIEANDKLVLLPTRDTNGERHRKDCKKAKAALTPID